MSENQTIQTPYWQRASIQDLVDDLRECDTVPMGVLSLLRRLAYEIQPKGTQTNAS